MTAEAFLVCALSLPATFSGNQINPSSVDNAIREYKQIRDLLENTYPGHEFLIVYWRHDAGAHGWEKIPFEWKGYVLYKRSALALPPVSFPPIHDDTWFHEFSESFQITYPGREMWFVKGYALPPEQFDKVPYITYRGYTIYARRAS